MNTTKYSRKELSAIVGFCAWSLTSAVDLESFLRELAAIMEADAALAVRLGLQFDEASPIASANRFTAGGARSSFESDVRVPQSSLPRNEGVSFCGVGRTLKSVLLRGGQWNCTLILSRTKRRFSARDAQSLQVIHSAVYEKLLALQALSLAGRPADLPPRIQDVKNGLLEGLSDKQIAARLRISPHTVHTHVKSLFKRQGVNSRAELLSAQLKKHAPLVVDASMQTVIPSDQLPPGYLQLNLKDIAASNPIATVLNPHRDIGLGIRQPARKRADSSTKLENRPAMFASNHNLNGR